MPAIAFFVWLIFANLGKLIEVNSTISGGSQEFTIENRQLREPTLTTAKRKKADDRPAKKAHHLIDVGKLKLRVISELQRQEANRTKLLGQQERNTPSGLQTWYLVGIDKPSESQIKEVRELVREQMNGVADSAKNDLDQWIGDEIDRYDSFGVLGKRAAIIMIPEDPSQQMVAYVYTTDDLDAELQKIDPNNKFSYEFPNLKMYFREDASNLMRFAGIIKE